MLPPARRLVVLVFTAALAVTWLALGMHRGILLSCDDRTAMWPWVGVLTQAPLKAPVLSDADQQFVPWLRFARRELAAGRLPLWNPHQDGGVPLLGNGQSALGSPLVWPALLLGVDDGWNLTILLRILVAATGAYLWLRALRRSRAAAGLGAAMFALSGPFVAWLEHPHTLAAAPLPWLLYFVTRYRRGERVGDAAGIAASTYLVLAGGHPETAVMVALLAAVPAAAPPRPIRGLVSTAPFAVGGVLLAAPLLLPLAEYLRLSAAWAGERPASFVLPVAALARFVAPGAAAGHPIEGAASVSVVGLALAVVGAVVLWRRGRRRWPLVALVCLAVAYHNPLSVWLARATPVYWSRALLPLALVLGLLAAAGLDRLRAAARARGAARAASALGLAPVIVFAELAIAARGVHAVNPPWLLHASTPMLELLRADEEPFRVLPIGIFLPPNLATVEGLDDVRGYDALAPRGWRERRVAMGRFVDDTVGIDRLAPGGRALDEWNVKYLLAPPRGGRALLARREELGLDLALIYQGRDGAVLLNRRVLPRVRIDGRGTAEIEVREPGRWRVRTTAETGARLVVADPYFPGWRATIDGRRTPLDLAPGDPFAVPLPAGTHVVELRYSPASFRLGLALALLAALCLAAWAVLAARTARAAP